MKKILHLSNDYLGSKVYKELYWTISETASSTVEQVIFVPLRSSTSGSANMKKSVPFQIHYSDKLSFFHRVFFESKQRLLYRNLLAKININCIDLVHATTLFSDGALAYKIFTRFGIPYIVTVRSTDISVFLKYRPDLYKLGLDIMANAKEIVFISNVLFQKTIEHKHFQRHKLNIMQKSSIIPNGIENFWLDNRCVKQKTDPSKLVYVGTLIKRKNVLRLIESVLSLKNKFPNLSLTIVGATGKDEEEVTNLAASHPGVIHYLGAVNDKKQLISILRSHHVFAMPSFNETFGLVYIEALSQGLPVIYSKNDGVDGIIAASMGEAVDPFSIESIKEGISRVLENYDEYNIKNSFLDDFSWEKISSKYLSIYNDVNNSNNN